MNTKHTRRNFLRTAAVVDAGLLLSVYHNETKGRVACEDTILFPAWKQTLTAAQLDERGEKFEEIEQHLSEDSYEEAVQQLGDLEDSLGLTDLAQVTAPPPPIS